MKKCWNNAGFLNSIITDLDYINKFPEIKKT